MDDGLNKNGWEWWGGRDDEFYQVSDNSREAVIEACRNDFDGEPFHICEARLHTFPFPKADEITDWIFDHASDSERFLEAPSDPQGTPAEWVEAHAEMDALLSAWFAKWRRLFPAPDGFAQVRNREDFPAVEEQPA